MLSPNNNLTNTGNMWGKYLSWINLKIEKNVLLNLVSPLLINYERFFRINYRLLIHRILLIVIIAAYVTFLFKYLLMFFLTNLHGKDLFLLVEIVLLFIEVG